MGKPERAEPQRSVRRSKLRPMWFALLIGYAFCGLLWWHWAGSGHGRMPQSRLVARPPMSNVPTLDSEKQLDSFGLRCLPLRRPRTLLVEVPFTSHDLPSLEIALGELWEGSWPCYQPPLQPSRPDLVLAFNGNLSDPAHAELRARLRTLTARPVIRSCFDRVTIESAYLSGVYDMYDKRRLSANWTVGPNRLFLHFLEAAASRRYRYMVQLEPDVMPLRPLWLEELYCLASHSAAWVVGSPFLGRCAYDTHAGRCKELGAQIKFHLNGNALYATGDAAFRAYWALAFGSHLSLWPFDLALHMHMQTLPEANQRRLQLKFQTHPFLLNFGAEPIDEGAIAALVAPSGTGATIAAASAAGVAMTASTAATAAPTAATVSEANAAAATSAWSTIPPVARTPGGAPEAGAGDDGVLPRLRRASPQSFLVHTSWGAAQLRNRGLRGYAALGVPAPALGSPAAAHVAAHTAAAQPSAELMRLARAAADSEGRLILTFATALYDRLCRNFVAHVRRLRLTHYMITTFTADYHRTLSQRGERPYLHPLSMLRSPDGSDAFASNDFFRINAARYTVLGSLLRSGVHVFSVDLDVVLLADPLPYVWAQPQHELLLQSDARDAVSLNETSPFLLQGRLHLPRTTASSRYVNGGVFFARATERVALLFEATWEMASQDLGTLNEQDCLNRVLASTEVPWAPLPPALFPNGFVYFRRPLPRPEPQQLPSAAAGGEGAPTAAPTGGAAAPVLVHCNWINGIAAKRFEMREALLWADDADVDDAAAALSKYPQESPPTTHSAQATAAASAAAAGRFLAYAVGESAGERSLGAQVHALRVALALAHLSNRTLLMPSFYVLPVRPRPASHSPLRAGSVAGGTLSAASPPHTQSPNALAAAEARSAQREGRRIFTYLFEYMPLLQAFPNHRESSLLRTRWASSRPTVRSLPSTPGMSIPGTSAPGDNSLIEGHAAGQDGIRVAVADSDGSSEGEDTADEFVIRASNQARSSSGVGSQAAAVRTWLRALDHEPLLYVKELYATTLDALLEDATERAQFSQRLSAALQPAPELRIISQHIVSTIHAFLSRYAQARSNGPSSSSGQLTARAKHMGRHERRRKSSRASHGRSIGRRPLAGGGGRGDGGGDGGGGGGRGGGGGGSGGAEPRLQDFNCLYVSRADLESAESLREAAGPLPLDAPTLLVRELGAAYGDDADSGDHTAESATAEAALVGVATEGGARRHDRGAAPHRTVRSPPIELLRSPLPAWASTVLTHPLQVSDHFPYWDEVEVRDAIAGHTLAYDLVQQLVCSAARRVHGPSERSFVVDVCQWRSVPGIRPGGQTTAAAADVCSTYSV